MIEFKFSARIECQTQARKRKFVLQDYSMHFLQFSFAVWRCDVMNGFITSNNFLFDSFFRLIKALTIFYNRLDRRARKECSCSKQVGRNSIEQQL